MYNKLNILMVKCGMITSCPGAAWARNPTITEKICPRCGREIELFSVDPCMPCECGFIAYNDTQNCLKWCEYARQCVGEEIYQKFISAKKEAGNTGATREAGEAQTETREAGNNGGAK